jgi:hypothetical protein
MRIRRCALRKCVNAEFWINGFRTMDRWNQNFPLLRKEVRLRRSLSRFQRHPGLSETASSMTPSPCLGSQCSQGGPDFRRLDRLMAYRCVQLAAAEAHAAERDAWNTFTRVLAMANARRGDSGVNLVPAPLPFPLKADRRGSFASELFAPSVHSLESFANASLAHFC